MESTAASVSGPRSGRGHSKPYGQLGKPASPRGNGAIDSLYSRARGRPSAESSSRAVSSSLTANAASEGRNVQRKTSVADLLSRLTTPTAASRSKMRDRTPDSSSPHQLRSASSSMSLRTRAQAAPGSSQSPRTAKRYHSNPGAINISRPILMRVGSSRSPRIGSPASSSDAASSTATPTLRRKAPPDPTGCTDATPDGSASTSPDLTSKADVRRAVRISKSPAMPLTPTLQQLPLLSTGRDITPTEICDISDTRSPSEESPVLSFESDARRNSGSEADRSATGSLISQSVRSQSKTVSKGSSRASPRASLPTTPKGSTNSSPSAVRGPMGLGVRTVSSTPPAQAVTKPRALSKIGLERELAALNALEHQPQADRELNRYKKQNENLKAKNRQLKAQLESAMTSLEQTNVELTMAEASRSSLQQQVSGHELFQAELERRMESMQKRLRRSQRLVTLLEANLQDFKVTLEERHIENYDLKRRLAKARVSSVKLPLSPPQSLSEISENDSSFLASEVGSFTESDAVTLHSSDAIKP